MEGDMRSLRIGVLLIVILSICAPAWGADRVALVIGNSDYKHTAPLQNPRHDAQDIANVLQRLDFEVIRGLDLDRNAMIRAIRQFADQLRGAKVGLFFYAGHGLQVAGQNYLAPTDAELTSASALDFELVRLDLIHRTMERETTTNILILDACRDNPLARNLARSLGTRSSQIGRGLASVESGEGTLISFSTQPGNVALDGRGRNSPFAEALKKHIAVPGDDLATILVNVRNDVMQATARRQVPWEHSALTARFYFTDPDAPASQQAELALWDKVKESDDPAAIASYLRRYPHGAFAVVARNLMEALERQRALERELASGRRETTDRLREEQDNLRKAQEAARAQTPSGSLAAATPPAGQGDVSAQSPYDGYWRVDVTGNAACPIKNNTIYWVISRGTLESRGKGPAQVAADGGFQLRTRSKLSASHTVIFTGKLEGDKGSGSYQVENRRCAGTIKLSRQNPGLESERSAAATPRSDKDDSSAQHPFDGIWKVDVRGGAGCPVKTFTIYWVVARGMLESRGRGAAPVAANGNFEFRTQSRRNANLTVIFTGKLEGVEGSGTYRVEGHRCAGTVKLSRNDVG
jgi:hypothetical protein